MAIELIIHGKPIQGSHKATSGIDPSFCKNLVQVFFASMDRLSGKEVLIVDARQWKNVWYGVYTFWHGANVKGTDGRNSFFAVTVVLPRRYFYVVSEVYSFLKKVCAEYVVGRYISKDGKYLVQDLSDEKAFVSLVAEVQKITETNLLEGFDNGFKPQSQLLNDVYYNVLDCDARSFVQELRKCGRILVTDTAETKDAKLAAISKYEAKIAECQKEIAEKNKKIEELNKQKKDLEEANNSASKNSRQLKENYNKLKGEKEQFEKKYEALHDSYEEMNGKLEKVASLLGVKVSRMGGAVPETKRKRGWVGPFTILNTILLAGLFIVVLMIPRGCTERNKVIRVPNDKSQILTYEQDSDGKDVQEAGTDYSSSESEEEGTVYDENISDVSDKADESLDADCGISVSQENRLIHDYNAIDLTKPVVIYIKDQKDGYAIHTSNISNENDVQFGKPVTIQVNNENDEVIICYRSSDRNKTNPRNRITIKPKR